MVNTPPKVNEFTKQRTQSFNAENAMQHVLSVEQGSSQHRPRADSYQVSNPIPEEEKVDPADAPTNL